MRPFARSDGVDCYDGAGGGSSSTCFDVGVVPGQVRGGGGGGGGGVKSNSTSEWLSTVHCHATIPGLHDGDKRGLFQHRTILI